MPRARLIVDDVGSAVVEQLRRTVNGLLLMMETAEQSITDTATAEDVLNAWADAIRTGRDDNPAAIANITSTGVELLGVRATPKVPRSVRGSVADMTVDDV